MGVKSGMVKKVMKATMLAKSRFKICMGYACMTIGTTQNLVICVEISKPTV